jgi:hypothetical protein
MNLYTWITCKVLYYYQDDRNDHCLYIENCPKPCDLLEAEDDG